ncbi:DUF4262 domain-containing protein [Agrobacterium rubi]|nr:DUF4262 domain-containing protein [Agrobacterium rubi]NTF23696.1 DUF4262 domain-containing protein [Agrobacterium rubi]
MTSALAKIASDARLKLETMPFIVPMMESDGRSPGRAYSVGLTKVGHPEITIVGIDLETARSIITVAGNHVLQGTYDFREPCICANIAEGYDVAFRPVTRGSLGGGFGLGRAVLETEFPVVQLYFPDVEGYFPWQRKVDRKFKKLQSFFNHDGAIPMTRLEAFKPH